MASSSVAWMPTRGRHQISIGPSLGRAIKARKLKGSPAPTTKRSNLPERDFYALRYNFKPGAIDTTRPASIEVKKGPENTQILAEFPSKETNEVCTYGGSEIPAREVDCIIIYDEDTGQYTLEKLDSVISLQFGGKRIAAPSAPSPAAATETPSTSTPSGNAKGKLPQAVAIQEEEEEGEEIEIPLRVQISKRDGDHATKSQSEVNTSQLPPSYSIKTHTASSSKPSQKSSPTLPAKAARPSPKKTKAPPPPLPSMDKAPHVEEEIIEIERPAKRSRLSTTTTPRPPQITEPPKPKSPLLSLPGGHSSFVVPPVPTLPASSKKETNTKMPIIPISVPPGVSKTITMEEILGDEDDDDEEDWEAVPTPAVPVQEQELDRLEDEIFGAGFGEEGEGEVEQEIDVKAFEAELFQQMEVEDDDEDEDDDDMEDVLQEVASGSRPISLNRLASGMAAEGDSDEDFSSSDSDSD